MPATLPPEPIGWPLLPIPDADGRLAYPSLDASVRQRIRIILMTRPGEQLGHSTYGAGLAAFLHQPNTLETRKAIHDRIREHLVRWEPRIDLDQVEVWPVDDRPEQLRIEITYRLRRTGAAGSVALTMELGR